MCETNKPIHENLSKVDIPRLNIVFLITFYLVIDVFPTLVRCSGHLLPTVSDFHSFNSYRVSIYLNKKDTEIESEGVGERGWE